MAPYTPFGLSGGEENQISVSRLIAEHKKYIVNGLFKEINFDTTSNQNNLLIQCFEVSDNPAALRKLDFIDFGVHKFNKSDPETYRVLRDLSILGYEFPDEVHIVFAGKLFFKQNTTKTYSFVRYFTLIFG